MLSFQIRGACPCCWFLCGNLIMIPVLQGHEVSSPQLQAVYTTSHQHQLTCRLCIPLHTCTNSPVGCVYAPLVDGGGVFLCPLPIFLIRVCHEESRLGWSIDQGFHHGLQANHLKVKVIHLLHPLEIQVSRHAQSYRTDRHSWLTSHLPLLAAVERVLH